MWRDWAEDVDAHHAEAEDDAGANALVLKPRRRVCQQLQRDSHG